MASYRQHWQQTFERKGRLARSELRVANEGAGFNNAINTAVKDKNNPDRLIKTFAVSYALYFDHDFDLINYRVVRDVDGKERINDAGHHVPGWSYDAAEPW
jgi:hypothetical protein